jgi:putative Mg2+ transporter-C (MgtC) family protein
VSIFRSTDAIMPVTLDWQQVALRLVLTVVAGLIIGFNRGEHGRPAGMRTTLLVCLAASLSMIQANLLMNSVGKTQNSFVVLDLMRLPLGILSGMGFIGAGAILRRDSMVLGVTTAATLWFTTMMGLCFGGGQIGLGTSALILGLGTLWGLKYAEGAIRQDVRATLTVIVSRMGPSDDEIRGNITQDACTIISWGISYMDQGERRQIRTEIERRVLPSETKPPTFIAWLAQNAQVLGIEWKPQGLPAEAGSQQSEPKGTPISISGPK